MAPQHSTRREFLTAVCRSLGVRATGYVVAGLVIAKLVTSLWPQRFLVGGFVAIIGCLIVIKSARYYFGGTAYREQLDAEQELVNTHWGSEYRGLFWSGFGLALGNLFAFVNTDRDPAGFVVAGGLCAVGALAHFAAIRHSANTPAPANNCVNRSGESGLN